MNRIFFFGCILNTITHKKYQLFNSQFPETFKPNVRRKTAHPDIKYKKHLEKNYEKLIALFVKYRREKHETLRNAGQSRFIINKLFKSNSYFDLNPVVVVYLRLFLMQNIKIVSYPKKNFYINFIQVTQVLTKLIADLIH